MRDGIELTSLADPAYQNGASFASRVAIYSPDNSQFAVVTQRGDLATQKNVYDLYIYKSSDVATGALAPMRHLSFASDTNDPGVSQLQWSSGGESITFIAKAAGSPAQVKEYWPASERLETLTNSKTSIVGYARSAKRDRIVYVARASWTSLWTPENERSGYIANGYEFLTDLIEGREGRTLIGLEDETDLYLQDGNSARAIHVHWHLGRGFTQPILSPDATKVIVWIQIPPNQVPSSWSQYDDWMKQTEFKVLTRPYYAESSFEQLEVLDLASGKSQRLIDAPYDQERQDPQFVWARGGAALIFSTAMPLDIARKLGISDPIHNRTVAVDLPTGKISLVGNSCEEPYAWDAQSNTLDCLTALWTASREDAWAGAEPTDSRRSASHAFFQWTTGGWQKSTEVQAMKPPAVEVFLREQFDMPPKIMAYDTTGQRQWTLIDLNPQLQELTLARVENIELRLNGSRKVSAGLFYPANFVSGKRYPLVIQTHGWIPSRFMFGGLSGAGYVAQPLTSRGFFVLQVDDLNWKEAFTDVPAELRNAFAVYRAGIKYLNDRALIDSARVGILGWSHSCFYAKYALAHTKLFAAAAWGEGVDGGYLQYITGWNDIVDADSFYGGPPFGPKNLSQWIAKSPSFNLADVHAPVRIAVHDPHHLLLDWEWYEGLADLRKPVEMIMFRDADHYLKKPYERFGVEEGNVDWFDFWLNGREDADPVKREQYDRWEKLCDLQMSQKPGGPTFCRHET